MSKEERYAEHTVAWELPKCDSVTKGNYNLADIETKYMPIQTEAVNDSKDKIIADLETKLAEVKNSCDYYMKRSNDLVCEIGEYKKHIRFKGKEITELKQQLAESEVKIANLEVLLLENANDMKAMQEFKIGEDEYDLTDEDARNSLCWEVEELKQQLHDLPKKIVGEIKDKIPEIGGMKCEIIIDDFLTLNTLLDTILKKYGEENE